MIDSYLAGTQPTLTEFRWKKRSPACWTSCAASSRESFAKDDRKLKIKPAFAGNQDLLDTLWGYYFATGSHVPILRIMQMLPWSKSRDTWTS